MSARIKHLFSFAPLARLAVLATAIASASLPFFLASALISPTKSGIGYGDCAAIDDRTLAIGATSTIEWAAGEQNTFHIYQQPADGWIKKAQLLVAPLLEAYDQGCGLALGSDALALHAMGSERRNAPAVGILHVFIYNDVDRDLEYYAPIDRPLESWLVRLRDAAGVQIGADMLTDIEGTVHFPDLQPGEYTVCMVLQSHWINVIPGGPDGPIEGEGREVCQTTRAVTGNEPQLIFTNQSQIIAGAIRVKVFSDADGDGVYDDGESPIPGVNLLLMDGRYFPLCDPIPTDVNGEVEFAQLLGEYFVCTDDGLCQNATVVAYETVYVFFAIRPQPEPGTIHVEVYHDLNGDGDRDSNEPPLADWNTALFNAAGHGQGPERPTDVDGKVVFENLDAGPYRLCLRLLPVWRNTAPGQMAWPDVCRDITVASGQETASRFGNATTLFYYYLHLPVIGR